MGPSWEPEWPPIPGPSALMVLRRGPNCCAWSRYELNEECDELVVNDAGSALFGEAG
jgi:hypothetical protein